MFKRSKRVGKPTPEQQARQDRCRDKGCIACLMFVCRQPLPSEIHHQTKNGSQLGQNETVCLCSWHHRGICIPGMTRTDMEREYGPCLLRPRRFFEKFGDNAEQLSFQNRLIGFVADVVEFVSKILPRRNCA